MKKRPGTKYRRRRRLWGAFFLLLLVWGLYEWNIIPHPYYTNADFAVSSFVSAYDADGDGLDDQTDILTGAKAYIRTRPKYQSQYYATGYPDDEYGVCTDVVAQAFLSAGYDLMALVAEDIQQAPEAYAPDVGDQNIDFRRVRNLWVYFARHAESLTVDTTKIAEFQGGDILIFHEHIGIVSDKRNRKGVPFLIHHAYPGQLRYEEDILKHYEILAHYRFPAAKPDGESFS